MLLQQQKFLVIRDMRCFRYKLLNTLNESALYHNLWDYVGRKSLFKIKDSFNVTALNILNNDIELNIMNKVSNKNKIND